MRIRLTSVFVDDQARALAFYTDVLGFVKQQDFPVGEHRWLTVAPAEAPHGAQLLLEPNDNPAARAYQRALYEQGIPAKAFEVDDLVATHARLAARGVAFQLDPSEGGGVTQAVFDDTCGNLIQLYQLG